MTVPNLPPAGSTDWYDWAEGVDLEARKVADKLDTTAASATYLSQAPGTGLTEGATKAELDAETTARTTADGLRLLTADAPELIRDTIGSALVAGTNVTITPNDVGDTITIAAAAGGGGDATVIQVAAPTGTASTDTANVQAALTTAAAATGTTSRVVRLAPGQYEINAQLNVGARTLLRGAARGTTTLRWSTDLGAGQYGIKNSSGWNQADAPAFSDLTMIGPAPLPATMGVQGANMRGIQLGRNSTMTDCFVSAFGAGIEIYGDHQTLTRVKTSNSFYNILYPSATPTHGDQTYLDCTVDGASMACIAVEAGNTIDSSEFFGGHCGVAPFGILKLDVGGPSGLDGLFKGCVQNTVFYGFSFEDIGNSAIFDESTVSGSQNTILEVTMVNVGFSYKDSTRIAARPKDYAVKARNMDRVRITGGATPFTPGDVAVFSGEFVGPMTLMQNNFPSNLFGPTGGGNDEGFVAVDTGQIRARQMSANGTITQGDLLEFAGSFFQVQRYGSNPGKGFAGVAAADALNGRVLVVMEGLAYVNTETCTNGGQVLGIGTTLKYHATEVPNTPNSSAGNPAAPTGALVIGVSTAPKNGTRTLVRLNGSHGTPQAGYVRPTTVTSLPTASATYRGQLLVTQGGTGAADVLSVCLKSTANTYSWKTVSTG